MSLKTPIFSLLATIGCFALSFYQMLLLIPYVNRHSSFLKFLVGTVCNLCSPGLAQRSKSEVVCTGRSVEPWSVSLRAAGGCWVGCARNPPLPSLWGGIYVLSNTCWHGGHANGLQAVLHSLAQLRLLCDCTNVLLMDLL